MFWVLIIFSLWCLIYPVTDYSVRWLLPGVIRKAKPTRKKIHLSFDDGPDPRYTPYVLDILKQLKIPATFFVIGEKAQQNRELILRIISEGHQIGLHTQHHRHAYLIFWKESVKTIREGYHTLQTITGRLLEYFRPPWGALNLFEYILVKKLGLKIVLWSANAQDWSAKTHPEEIVRKIQAKLSPGMVIVLHDSGGDLRAPLNTIEALPEIIRKCQEEGYEFVTLDNLLN